MNGTYITFWLYEVQKRLTGLYIDDICKHERLVQIVLGKESLYISLYPDAVALCLNRKESRHYESINSFSTLVRGLRIEYVKQVSFKPILHIGFQKEDLPERNDTEITIMLYREAPNLLISRGSVQRKLFSRIVEKKPKKSLWDLSRNDLNELFVGVRQTVEKKILVTFEGIDQNLAKELTSERAWQLQKSIHNRECGKPRLVSIRPLLISLFEDEYLNEYASFNDLAQYAIGAYIEILRHERAALEKRKVIRNLKRKIGRLRKKVLPSSEIEHYRIMGDYILANLTSIKKGALHAVVPAISGNGTYEISLDPQKSPQENAQAYFKQYKKLKRGQPHISEKIARLQEELVDVQARASEPVRESVQKRTKSVQHAAPFRVFHLDSGADVYVGKNARSNDRLTFSYANPHDYFFHVRGYQGSHVILRANVKRGHQAAKKDIETAAAIAVYYSKAKTQKQVPVSYTQRKYLKKSKKGKPGTVTLMREEVIFVDPDLPCRPS